jgi:hypothetical protein
MPAPDTSFRARRSERLKPALPPITPASQWGGV